MKRSRTGRFSLYVGTIFENTNYLLRTWFRVLYLMLSSKKETSTSSVGRAMSTTRKHTHITGPQSDVQRGDAKKRAVSTLILLAAGIVVLGGQQRQPAKPQTQQTNQQRATATGEQNGSTQPPTSGQIFVAADESPPPPANKQTKVEQFFDKAQTDPVVWVTVVIAFFAGWQVLVYRAMRDHTKVVERAYVILSHETRTWGEADPHPRALDFRGDEHATQREVWFTIQVQNHGRTPANILGGGIWIRTGPETYPPPTPSPEIPPHYPVRLPPAFVVPSDHPSITSMIWIEPQTFTRVEAGTERLWLIGHVDYRDQFGNGHRGGYGRCYDRYTRQLVFDETTGALNYDRFWTAHEQQQYTGQD